MKNILTGILVLAVCCLASCQKKDETPVDLSKVTVAFSSLSAGQVFHKGDTVNIAADVSYISEISGVGIQVTDSATGEVLFTEDHDLHTDHYAVDELWVDTLSGNSSLQVKILVFVAHGSEPAEGVVWVTSVP